QLDVIGKGTRDEFSCLVSEPIVIQELEKKCRFVLDGYEDDDDKVAFLSAARTFLSLTAGALRAASSEIHRYYVDCNSVWEPDDLDYLAIAEPEGVWSHIQAGTDVAI